ncbi:unnamed protein product [[Candida] boidinii]|uniref:Unnamed protein product n=1 Tax=Candida boidinii TaxID=5477 RepID=A0ACB5TWA4_CANBO|nr:unnamed protein product [[Candida] boidinii]
MKVNELVELIESNKYLLRESILNDENPYLLTGPNNLLSKDKISNYPIIYSKYITNLNDLNKLNDIFNKNKNYKKKLTINIDDDDDEDQDKDKDYEFQHGQRLIDTEPTHLFDGLKEGELDITVNKEAQDVIVSNHLLAVYSLGKYMTGHANIIHGGTIATLVDEVFCRCAFQILGFAVTAKLAIDYLNPITLPAEEEQQKGHEDDGSGEESPRVVHIVIRCYVAEISADRRKCTVTGYVENIDTCVKYAVGSLLIVKPRWK